MGYYTKKGFKKLRNSLDELRVEYEKKLLELGQMEKDNNLAESTEFIRARFNISYTYDYKRKEIIDNLNQAIIIEQTEEYENWDGKSVSRKCIVTVNYRGEEETFTILGENETDLDNNVLSCSALLVLAMLGHKVGEFVDFNGDTIYIESVRRIDNDLVQEESINMGLR